MGAKPFTIRATSNQSFRTRVTPFSVALAGGRNGRRRRGKKVAISNSFSITSSSVFRPLETEADRFVEKPLWALQTIQT
jgi:hypothetical protein